MNRGNAKKLTKLSLELFSTFYAGLYLLEKELKCAVYTTVKEKLGPDWFANQLRATHPDTLFKEEAAFIGKRKNKNYVLTDEKLIAESGFGFWVEFFNPRIYKMTKGVTLKIFSERPKDIKRKDIYNLLVFIKNYRNLLFHSRIPIIMRKEQAGILKDLEMLGQSVDQILTWMNIPDIVYTKPKLSKRLMQKIFPLLDEG